MPRNKPAAQVQRTRPQGTIPQSRARVMPDGPEGPVADAVIAQATFDAESEPRAAARPPRVRNKRGGRTSKQMLATPAPAPRRPGNRPPTRQQPARDLARETTRQGAVVVVGRDGETLTRRRTSVGDKYHVPANEIPRGWDYQWNPVTVYNKEVTEESLIMAENGWRPVPADRHPGRWTAQGYKGQIIVEGLRLEERPMSLSVEAKNEDIQRAKTQIRDQTDSLRLTQKQLPGSREARNRQVGGGMRMSIDPALDIPLPQHRLADEAGAEDE